MANNKNTNPADNNQTEKKMTRYDRKMQFRKEQEAKAKKNAQITKGVCGLVIVAAIAGAGYTGYKSYQAKYGPYIQLGSDKIDQKEFNYYYASAFNTFYSQYGSYASYFGLDVESPLDQQSYSDTMTWKDYFEQQAVNQLMNVHALNKEGKANSFEYDATQDVEKFKAQIQEGATEQEMSDDEYCASVYGDGITLDMVLSYAESSAYASAYYTNVVDGFEITDEEIETYYNENKDSYDLVDYDVCEIAADIPETEETDSEEELSDEEKEALEAEQAEATEKAMAEAEVKANEMLSKIKDEKSFAKLVAKYSTTEDPTYEMAGMAKSGIYTDDLAEWLFDESRAAGDTTVVRSDDDNCFYVAYYKDRKINDKKTVDVRHILVQTEDVEETDDMTDEEKTALEEEAKAKAKETADQIYADYLAGDQTEDAFAALANEKSEDTGSNTKGGLYEAVKDGDMVAAFNDWIFDENRKAGDTDIVESSYGYHVMYFVGDNDPEWVVDIKEILEDNKSEEYLQSITADFQPVEVNGTLNYLHIAEETETEAETETATETEAK